MDENKLLEEKLVLIKKLEDKQVDVGMRMMSAYGGALYPLDLFALGAIKRSLSLCAGFKLLIGENNFTCAAAILRMQLDNALRLFAAFVVKEPHKFAVDVMDGISIRKLKDNTGQFMTDRHLVNILSKKYKWVERVYVETSKFVHLSDKHVFGIFTRTNEIDRTADISISARDDDVKKSAYVEAVDAFIAATNIFLDYLEGWVYTKSNPEEVAKLKADLINRKILKNDA